MRTQGIIHCTVHSVITLNHINQFLSSIVRQNDCNGQCLAVRMYVYNHIHQNNLQLNIVYSVHTEKINLHLNTPPVALTTIKGKRLSSKPTFKFPDKHPATGHKVVRTRTKATPNLLLGHTSLLAKQPRIRGQQRVGNRH